MSNKIQGSILRIASKHCGIGMEKLSINDSINNDLKIDGDDIADLLNEINRENNLNHNGFEFNKYFNSENDSNFISNFINLLRKKTCQIEYDVKLIDLVRWIENGYWAEYSSGSDK